MRGATRRLPACKRVKILAMLSLLFKIEVSVSVMTHLENTGVYQNQNAIVLVIRMNLRPAVDNGEIMSTRQEILNQTSTSVVNGRKFTIKLDQVVLRRLTVLWTAVTLSLITKISLISIRSKVSNSSNLLSDGIKTKR